MSWGSFLLRESSLEVKEYSNVPVSSLPILGIFSDPVQGQRK